MFGSSRSKFFNRDTTAKAPSAPSKMWPPVAPFSLRLRFAHVSFRGGLDSLPALLLAAPGGAHGRVLVGLTLVDSGVPVAVKVLQKACIDAFLREAESLNRLRAEVDTVRVLEVRYTSGHSACIGQLLFDAMPRAAPQERGVPLTLEDAGALHVAYAYGTGEEPDMSAVHQALPHGPALLLFVEPLVETLTERLRRATTGHIPLVDALRAARDIALGLAFISKRGIVVRCWMSRTACAG